MSVAVAGKTILVHAEQGFGDTIQFARYVPLIRGAGSVTAEVQKPLVRLARTLAPDVEVISAGDDMPAHIKMVLTRTSETIPFAEGRLLLGTWQGIFLWEHRRAPHVRRVMQLGLLMV